MKLHFFSRDENISNLFDQNNGKVLEPWRMTPPPDNRGDRPGRGVEGVKTHTHICIRSNI